MRASSSDCSTNGDGEGVVDVVSVITTGIGYRGKGRGGIEPKYETRLGSGGSQG